MRSTVSAVLLLAAVLTSVIMGNVPAAAQTSAEAGRAVSTVINHRISWMADSTRFDACKVRQAMNDQVDFLSHIIEPVRGLLDDVAAPCPRPAHDPRDYTAVVLVDSLRFADTTANVYLTVLRGELRHREIYRLERNRSSAAYMPLLDVRLWGHGQAYVGSRVPEEP